MSSEKPSNVVVKRRGSQFKRNVLSKWPLLVWLGVAWLTWNLFQQGIRFERMNGEVYAEHESVAPLATGKLLVVEVEKGDVVHAGKVVARMDRSLIKKRIEEFKHNYQIERLDRRRRFETDFNDAQQQLAAAETEADAKRKESNLANEVFSNMESDTSGLYTILQINEAKAKAARLKIEATNAERQVTQLTTNRDSVKNLLDELQRLDPQQSAQETTTFQLLQRELENCDLKAERPGVVYSILQQPGEVIQAGNPVLTIVTEGKKTVRGMVLEKNAGDVEKGSEVWVTPREKPQDIRSGKVLAVSPSITAFHDPGSAVNNAMIRGREIVISLPEDDTLIPGQAVIIHLEEPGKLDLWSFGKRKPTLAD